MTDIFLYQGEANPNDVKLTDPTVLAGGGASITGTGAIVFAVAGLAGTALETFTGTGAAAFAVPGFASSGAETFTGTAAVAFAGPALAATGAETFTGTGAIAFGVPALSGTGETASLDVSGTGAVVFAVPALAGTALETFSSTGAMAFAVPALDGGEPPAVTGAGDVTFAAPGLTGTATGGDDVSVGHGSGYRYVSRPLPPLRQTIDGLGAVAFGGPDVDGRGVLAITGTGSTLIQSAELDGDGAQQIDGTAEMTQAVALEGAGHVLTRRHVTVKARQPVRSIQGVGQMVTKVPATSAALTVTPDAIDRAWSDLQTEDDELMLLLGVIS